MNTKIYLDSRHTLKNGCQVLTIAIMHNGQSARIPTGMELDPKRWDAKSMQVIKGNDRAYLNMELRRKQNEVTECAQKILLALDREGKSVTATDLKNRVKRLIGMQIVVPSEIADSDDISAGESLTEYYTKIMNQYQGSTREKYAACLRYIRLFDPHADYLTFDSINGRWLRGLDDCMKTNGCKSADTRSMYMRPFKHVCQCAYDEELISRNPFKKYHFRIEQEEPVHKIMNTNALRQLVYLEMEEWREKYRDFFWLSFLMRGANPVDMLLWQRNQVRDGYLYYKRIKTGKNVVVKIEPEMRLIINKYKGRQNLLCFCDGLKLNGNKVHDEAMKRKCKPFKDHVNKYLQELDGYEYLTLYWARHTWSTIAYDVNDDFKAVELGLSHLKGVTDRYVKAYQEKVDKANRRVIDHVLCLHNNKRKE